MAWNLCGIIYFIKLATSSIASRAWNIFGRIEEVRMQSADWTFHVTGWGPKNSRTSVKALKRRRNEIDASRYSIAKWTLRKFERIKRRTSSNKDDGLGCRWWPCAENKYFHLKILTGPQVWLHKDFIFSSVHFARRTEFWCNFREF